MPTMATYSKKGALLECDYANYYLAQAAQSGVEDLEYGNPPGTNAAMKEKTR